MLGGQCEVVLKVGELKDLRVLVFVAGQKEKTLLSGFAWRGAEAVCYFGYNMG